MFDAWNHGNVDRMVDFWWEDAVWEEFPEAPDRQTIRGRENVEARLREMIDVIGEMQIEVVELEEFGAEILCSVQARIAGAASGITLDAPSYHLIRFEEGRVRHYRVFTGRA